MARIQILLTTILTLVVVSSCKDTPSKEKPIIIPTETLKDSIKLDTVSSKKEEKEAFVLDEENAIPFFFEYAKTLKEDKVKLTTKFGSFTIQLYNNVPYHKANFIYLAKKGYFNNTMFHRVVKNFIIQGGNSDDIATAKKRNAIGRYLLPPDTRKGYRHDRGTISMPSSEMDNPHKLASPFEFFIVVKKPGSYHLDKNYTAFGRVIEGMDVVDEINNQPVEQGDWPVQNIYIINAEAF